MSSSEFMHCQAFHDARRVASDVRLHSAAAPVLSVCGCDGCAPQCVRQLLLFLLWGSPSVGTVFLEGLQHHVRKARPDDLYACVQVRRPRAHLLPPLMHIIAMGLQQLLSD